MRRIESHEQEGASAPMTESRSARHAWPLPRSTPRRGSNAEPRYRLAWRRGPRRARHDRTWGHLTRRASVVREVARREWSFTADPCGVATLVFESGRGRARLWRNWQARHYPFVCALLEELGKPNPFGSSASLTARASTGDSVRAHAARRNRSARS
jgi:hypothetical protein